MPFPSDARFVVLHGLRVKGLAEADTLTGVDDAHVLAKELEAEGLVQRRDGLVSGWRLTASGRREHDRLLAEELERSGARPAIELAYQRFLARNRSFLELCTDWQRGDAPDMAQRLDELHVHVRGVVDDLASALDRFGPYAARFDNASPAYERVSATTWRGPWSTAITPSGRSCTKTCCRPSGSLGARRRFSNGAVR